MSDLTANFTAEASEKCFHSRYFEDYHVGDEIVHSVPRTITEGGVAVFDVNYRLAALGYDAVLLTIKIAQDWKPGRDFPEGALTDKGGFAGIDGVRQGKFIEIDLAETDPGKAREAAAAMSQRLHANVVIEDYRLDIDE